MRQLVLVAVLLALNPCTIGCGSTPKPAPPASEEDIRRDEQEQKNVEIEERGTPIKKGQAKKPR